MNLEANILLIFSHFITFVLKLHLTVTKSFKHPKYTTWHSKIMRQNVGILLTWGTEGSLNLSALSNFGPLIVFGTGLLGSYVPGGGAQPKNRQEHCIIKTL